MQLLVKLQERPPQRVRDAPVAPVVRELVELLEEELDTADKNLKEAVEKYVSTYA